LSVIPRGPARVLKRSETTMIVHSRAAGRRSTTRRSRDPAARRTLPSSNARRHSDARPWESPSDKSPAAPRHRTVSPRVTEKIRKNARGAAILLAGRPVLV